MEDQGDLLVSNATGMEPYYKNGIIDAYTKAVNFYKVSGCWLKSAECYIKLAKLVTTEFQSMTMYANAGDMYKLVDHDKAIESYNKAINLCVPDGKFVHAAKCMNSIAEICMEDGNWQKAVESYDASAGYYLLQDSNATGMGQLNKAKDLCLANEEYIKAIQFAERMIICYKQNKLTQYRCPKLIVEMIMCYVLLGQNDKLEKVINSYTSVLTTSSIQMVLGGFVQAYMDMNKKSAMIYINDLEVYCSEAQILFKKVSKLIEC
jgi:tetratricopeptide (TPR) repeat protein